MSKRLVMSILSAAAMSIGGFFVSCGSHDDPAERTSVPVALPAGCTLVSPRDELGSPEGLPRANVKPGKNQFVISCGGQMSEIDRDVRPNQIVIDLTGEGNP